MVHRDANHLADTAAVEAFNFVDLGAAEVPGITSQRMMLMVVAMNRQHHIRRAILLFLKRSLPRSLKFLEAVVILSSTPVSSNRFWAR